MYRGGQQHFRALLHLILAHVLPELSLEPAPEPKAMDLTSSVVRYIMRNFRQPLSLEHYCKGAGRQQISPVARVLPRGCTPASGNM